MRLLTLLLASLFLSSAAPAQTPGSCDLGTAETDLNVGDVQARLFNTGSLFYGGSTTNGLGYIVPKGVAPPIFASGLWVGGFIDGDLRVAGSTYADFEFWPGPLNEDGTLPDPNDCSAFDRIWNVDVFDLQQYDDTGVATTDLAEWPVDLGAPVVDGDGIEGNYDLEAGDRPAVYGHQTAFWVMNDVGNEHFRNQTLPIGLEVRVTAFTSGELALDRYTFYRYELVNRNSEPFEDAIMAFFSDPDLGNASDDYVGSDSTRSMAFVYNENNDDAVYGTPPPAVGYDLLTGARASMYFIGGFAPPQADPTNGVERYNIMQGLWTDGTPMTEGGDGFMSEGPVLTWAFPGDPETDQFWSEVNNDGEGQNNNAGDRRHVFSSVPFTLAPGEARTFDLAILYALGTDHLNSVTQLKSVSDLVQARYDADELFVPGPTPPAPGFLATPSLLAPANGATFVDTGVPLSWTAVPEAESYRVEVASDPDFTDREVFYTAGTSLPFEGDPNEVTDYAWRVQATARGLLTSVYSDVRSFTFYRYETDNFGSGVGIVEVATPGGNPCPDADDPGCDLYDGNTVWLDPNSTDGYVVTNPDNSFADVLRNAETIDGDNFEMRFTADCASAGSCLGIYAAAVPGGTDLITSVPFELWNTGAEDDAEDEVRMIPIIRTPSGNDPIENWADAYTAEQEVVVDDATLTLNATHRVLWMMPDRENGYALFEAAANGFGGSGATYDPKSDGDTQSDPDCDERSQGYYIDFCYRGADNRFVAPIGGLEGIQLADLAGEGTTPGSGTTIRFDANERLLTDTEDEVPTKPTRKPTSFTLGAVYPNPLRSSATVPFEVGEAGRVRLSVYDVLGREVAVLADGERAAGTHRAALDGARLASGVYLVVLEADGRRQARKVMVLR